MALIAAAAAKGVGVTAVIAFANRGGEQNLRRLELRFLDAGIIVARSANDLTRYHGKYILINRRVLYVLSFNFTHQVKGHSRGFASVSVKRSTSSPGKVRTSVTMWQTPLPAAHTKWSAMRRQPKLIVSLTPGSTRRLAARHPHTRSRGAP
jgi:hypothetical protein